MSTARDMIEMLRRHYLPAGKPPPGIFAPEIQAPDSARRADLIFQGCTAAGGDELIGHEVKVTRADVLVELADPTKSDPWQRYCDHWWLVVLDPSLVEGLDLPPSWGVMAPPSGRRTRAMTVVVPAPKLNPAEKAPALRTLATWLHWRHHNAAEQLERSQREAERLREANTALHNRNPRDRFNGPQHDQVLLEIVEKLGGVDISGRIGTWTHQVTADDVVMALRDLGSVYHHAQSVALRARNVARDLNRLLKGVDEVTLRDLDQAAARLSKLPNLKEAS